MGFADNVTSLVNLIALTPEFQTWVGVDLIVDPEDRLAAAKDRVYRSLNPADYEDDDNNVLVEYPLCVIKNTAYDSQRDSDGRGDGCFSSSGTLSILFEDHPENIFEAITDFENSVSAIERGIKETSGLDDTMYIDSISNGDEPISGDDEKNMLYAEFKVTWGR